MSHAQLFFWKFLVCRNKFESSLINLRHFLLDWSATSEMLDAEKIKLFKQVKRRKILVLKESYEAHNEWQNHCQNPLISVPLSRFRLCQTKQMKTSSICMKKKKKHWNCLRIRRKSMTAHKWFVNELCENDSENKRNPRKFVPLFLGK